MKPIILNPLEQDVVKNATGWFAWHRVRKGQLRTPFPTREEAEQSAEYLAHGYGGKALLYAVDGNGGSACVASYSLREGWNRAEAEA